MHPSGKTLVAAMAQGGVVRLDLEAKGKALKLAAATGPPAASRPPAGIRRWPCPPNGRASRGLQHAPPSNRGQSVRCCVLLCGPCARHHHHTAGDFAERLGADRTEVKSLAFSPRGDALVLGGVDGSLKVLGWPALDVKLHLK